MSGMIRKLGVILTAIMAVMTAGISTGAPPGSVPPSGLLADDPCGGHYVGMGLKAAFSGSYHEGDVLYESSISNDIPGLSYRYAVPDGDCVFYFRNGHVGLTVDRSRNGRYVNMLFLGEAMFPTGTYCAPNPYFLIPGVEAGSWPNRFYFRTSTAYAWSRDGNGKLVLQKASTGIDFPALAPGDVSYCETALRFWILDDPDTDHDESADEYWASNDPVKVACVEVDGVVKWVIRPIAETYTIRTETKVKNKIVVSETTYSNALFRTVISGPRQSCLHGTFYLPFELIMEPL